MECNCVVSHLFQADTANGRDLSAEVLVQQFFAQTDAFKQFGTAIATYGGDSHLRHDFVEAFTGCFDVILLCCLVVLLYLSFLYKVVNDCKHHVRIHGGSAVTQQQGRMHDFFDFSTLYNECSLYALAYCDEVVMYGAHGKKRGNGCMRLVNESVGQDNIVESLLNALFRLVTEVE